MNVLYSRNLYHSTLRPSPLVFALGMLTMDARLLPVLQCACSGLSLERKPFIGVHVAAVVSCVPCMGLGYTSCFVSN